MPRTKKVLRYMAGIVEYEVTDETHWAQMAGATLTRCDHQAKDGGWGVVSQFNNQTGQKASWIGRMPDVISPDLWVEDYHIETYVTEQDVS
tara:strand:- start:127 stop:399 length:273 start_codon:yes stop_codon:yes gene_type:complete